MTDRLKFQPSDIVRRATSHRSGTVLSTEGDNVIVRWHECYQADADDRTHIPCETTEMAEDLVYVNVDWDAHPERLPR